MTDNIETCPACGCKHYYSTRPAVGSLLGANNEVQHLTTINCGCSIEGRTYKGYYDCSMVEKWHEDMKNSATISKSINQ